MDASEPQFLEVGAGARRRRIAYRWSKGRGETVQLLWLPGFLSDMSSTKALAVAEWADAHGSPMMRFDYSGHGLSGGDLLAASIGDWLEEAIEMLGLMGETPCVALGSSMGGWLVLLLARHLAKVRRSGRLAGLVLIAPAFDMTEALMWRELPAAARQEIEQGGVTYLPSAYGDAYPITKRLIEEGRSHLIEDHPFDPGCPVRVLQGMRDPDVPWRTSLALAEKLESRDVSVTLVKDGDHRLSTDENLALLMRTLEPLLTP